MRRLFSAKFRYDALRQEHAPSSLVPWDAAKCRAVVAAELHMSVPTLRTWLTEANKYYGTGRQRRVGGMGPKKKSRKKVGLN